VNAGGLFSFDSLAIVGASPRNGYAMGVIGGTKAVGYRGKVVCINPGAESVGGYDAYRSLAEVPFGIGAAVVVVRASLVLGIVEECGQLGIRNLTVISGGFAESGPDGRAVQEGLAQLAARYDLTICGPNCMGYFSLHDRTATYASSQLPQVAGSVAAISQSGGLLNEVMSYGAYRGVRFSKAISSGNEAALSLADYLEALVADPHTTTIGAFVEGGREPERLRVVFTAALRARKPIVMVKVGSSTLGMASARSHTGADAGDPVAFAALCAETGVILVEDPEELVETLLVLSNARHLIESERPPRGFAAIEISGGGKGIICDLADRYGLDLSAPRDPAATNPYDMNGSWERAETRALHEEVLAGFSADPRYDIIVSRFTVAPQGPLPNILESGAAVNRFRAAHPDRFHAILGRSSDAINPVWQQFCADTGLTYLQGYRRGIAALGRLQRYRAFTQQG
jgi:acyl-CoA synthetase (NDP forming)